MRHDSPTLARATKAAAQTTTEKKSRVQKSPHQTLDNAAHTSRRGPVRGTGELIEDVFSTYTGCKSIDDFIGLQIAGMALAESLRRGSAFTHQAVQPQIPPLLKEWLAQKQRRSPAAAVASSKTTANIDPSTSHGKRAMCSYANVPKAPPVLPRLAASYTSTGDLAEDGLPETLTPLLPALEELPDVVRCERGAVDTLRAYVDKFLRHLVHLIELTEALAARWGLLSGSERLALHSAIAGLTQSMVSRQMLMDSFTCLTFRDEGLEAVTEELDDCTHVGTLVLSDNGGLTEICHIPPRADTLLASACAVTHIDFSALTFVPSLCVLGLPFNKLRSLSFIAQLPSLRIMDVSHNELADMSTLTSAVCAHPALEELTLLGNPIALLEGYRRLVGTACRTLRALDGFALQSREREAFTAADYAQYEHYIHPRSPAATSKKAANEPKRHASPQSSRQTAAGDRRPSHVVGDVLGATADTSVSSLAHLQDEYENSVEATMGVLQITGLPSLLDQPVCIASEDELSPFSSLVLEAAGLTRATSATATPHPAATDDATENRSVRLPPWRLPATMRARVPVLERVLATLPGGGPLPTVRHSQTSEDPTPGSPRQKTLTVETAEVSAAGGGGGRGSTVSAPLLSGVGTKKGLAGKAPQRVPLYETSSVLRVHGTWASSPAHEASEANDSGETAEKSGEAARNEADDGVTIDIRAFDSAEYQVDGAAGSGLALLQASLPSGDGTEPAAAAALTTPPPSHHGARQGPVGKLRKAVAATIVEDTAILNKSVTRDLRLRPSLAARLRQPITLRVTAEDTVLVWNAEARKALLEGGGPGVPKALQKAVACSLSATTAATSAATSHTSPKLAPSSSPLRTTHSSRVSSPRPVLGDALPDSAAEVPPLDPSMTASSTVMTASSSSPPHPTLPPSTPRSVVETRTYHIGTFTVYPEALLSQNMHLRPPRAVPALATSARTAHSAANNTNSAGGGEVSTGGAGWTQKKGAPRAVLEGPAAELPCARELFVRSVALTRDAKAAEALARDVAIAQANLCAYLEAYAVTYEQLLLCRKEAPGGNNNTSNASLTAVPAAPGAHSASISLGGTLLSSSGLLPGGPTGAVSTPGTHGRARHTGNGYGAVTNNPIGGSGRQQSVRPVSGEMVTAQQWQKSLELWRAAVTDTAVRLMAAKTRAAELERVHLTVDVHVVLGRGPPPPLTAYEEARQAPVAPRDKSSKK